MYRCSVILFLLIICATVNAQDFGRLFTSPQQRLELDALRYHEELNNSEMQAENESHEENEVPKSRLTTIRLKGLVYRENGKNAAWINSLNTLEGDLSLEDIRISERDISSDQVEIGLPDTKVKLRVGEQYTPVDNSKSDIISENYDRGSK